jgi:hypothetical protein
MNSMKRRPIKLNEADVLNALIVDPFADQIRRAVEMGYSFGEIAHAIDMAKVHAQAEITGVEP